jgi:hypothetical protein
MLWPVRAGIQEISGNQQMRCLNCPSKGCYNCPMFGVGENPEYKRVRGVQGKERRPIIFI